VSTKNVGTKQTPEINTVPANTLTAMLALADNPTLNTDLLYDVSEASSAFSPALSATPTNFTIRLNPLSKWQIEDNCPMHGLSLDAPPRFEVIACIAERGSTGLQRRHQKSFLLATRGKVVTLQTISHL
jgi:hypothetical protein